jgi:predicted GNAT family acetyltransferase
MLNGEIVGHIYMEREESNKIKFLDAWVHEEHRLKGIFRKLWDTRWEYVKDPLQRIYCICLVQTRILTITSRKGVS